MAQLIVRNVDEKVVRGLKERAARNGRSTEAEHRALLEKAVMSERANSREKWIKEMRALRLRSPNASKGESTLEALRHDRDTR